MFVELVVEFPVVFFILFLAVIAGVTKRKLKNGKPSQESARKN